MFFIGKVLELIGISLLGVGLYVALVDPFGLSAGRAMGLEMGSLIVGSLIFFVGRLIEKR